MQMLREVGFAVVLGALLLALLWRLPTSKAKPAAQPRTEECTASAADPQAAAGEKQRVQIASALTEQRRLDVKARVLKLATELRSAHATDHVYDSSVVLDHLLSIYEELTSSGHEGLICLTEYCNAVSARPTIGARGHDQLPAVCACRRSWNQKCWRR